MTKTFTYTTTQADDSIAAALEHLDQVAIGYEARWGIGRLPKIVNEEMRQKWDRQMERLNAAITSGHAEDVKELVKGTVRGWAALEASAIAAGHAPLPVDTWQYHHAAGKSFNICKNGIDAGNKVDGYENITIAELINFYVANYQVGIKASDKMIKKTPGFDVDEILVDDELPF